MRPAGPSPSNPEAGRVLARWSSNGRAIRPLFLSASGGRVMDDSANGFVERQNIAHYIDQLITEPDGVKRNMLLKLLAEEVAKQVKASTRYLE